MKIDVVVDVGNSRIKWAKCEANGIVASSAWPPFETTRWRAGSYAAAHPDWTVAWKEQAEQWSLARNATWAVSGVHPERRDLLIDWIRNRGDTVLLIDNYQQLPLRIDTTTPSQVGMDRLLNAVAVNHRRKPGRGAVIVDAGSAVTVDWVDAEGVFGGGAILPGLNMMLTALHEHTALLPAGVPSGAPTYPGKDTIAAMQLGALHAVVGAAHSIVAQQKKATGATPMVFLTGGDGMELFGRLKATAGYWREMTLEGLRLTALQLPGF